MKIFNTLTRRKEEFHPLEPGKARMYNCGPTVYMYATVGNFRSFIFADTLRRYLEYQGLEVTQVMNITDVGHMTADQESGEDKLEKTAREQKKDPWQIAEFYTQAFFEDIDRLGVKRAARYPKATEHVEEMKEIIQKLLDRGHAYISNKCVYYSIATFPEYGRLSGNTLDDLMPGARLEINPDKRDPRDFALWVTDPKHIMRWPSPWGGGEEGYPYWHVECSAMAMKYLGETIDIHTGGEDNIFPHHECERAQSEGATGKPFSRYWMHARFLLVNGRKMSKSLGNFFTLRDLLEKGYDARAIRYLLLSTNYRQPLNFTLEGIDGAREAARRIEDFRARLVEAARGTRPENPAVEAAVEKGRIGFEAGMDDDLNVSPALAAIFNMMNEVNRLTPGPAGAQRALAFLERVNGALNVLPQAETTPDAKVENLIAAREAARKSRDFKRSDEIREQLRQMGVILEDTASGARWKRV